MAALHIHDAARILELGSPPYTLDGIRAARRRLAKQWHPDRAGAGQRAVHENHMVAINRAADLLAERAEESGGSIGATHVAAARQAARDEARAAGARAAAREADGAPRSDRRYRSAAPERSVVHSYARSQSHPEWGVGRVVGVFVTGEDEEVRRWAEISFAGQPIRTLRYENLQFVDFSRDDPGTERARRFLAAARRAAASNNHELAVTRLLHARSADPRNVTVLRLLALEQRARGDRNAALRACRDWAHVAPRDPQPHRLTQTLYADMGAHDLAAEAGARAADRDRRSQVGGRRRRRGSRKRRSAVSAPKPQ